MKSCKTCSEPVAMRGAEAKPWDYTISEAIPCEHPCHAAAQAVVEAVARWSKSTMPLKGDTELAAAYVTLLKTLEPE